MGISLKKMTQNIVWLIFDRSFILFLQFVVGIKIANYYGADLYGKYSYAISLVAFSEIFFELINPRVVKKFYTEDNYNNIVYNTSFFRNIMAFLLFFVPIILKLFFTIDNLLLYMLLLICFDNILNSTTFGIENFFEYKLESKRIVVSNNIVKTISYILQYICMILHMGILTVPVVRCFGSIVRVFILKYQYKVSYIKKQKTIKKFDRNLILKIINESKFLWMTFVSFLVYTQLDKIMIKYYLGEKEVGIYAIGIQLSSILAILIGPIQNSTYSKMLELYKKDYKEYYNFFLLSNTVITQIYLFLTFMSIIVVKYLFRHVYKSEYNPAIIIYSILAFSVFIKAVGLLQTSHLTIKGLTQKSFYKTLAGLILNVTLNSLLIPKYGINGAALATLMTQFFVLIFLDFFIKEYREHAFVQLKSFNTFYLLKMLKDIRVKNEIRNNKKNIF